MVQGPHVCGYVTANQGWAWHPNCLQSQGMNCSEKSNEKWSTLAASQGSKLSAAKPGDLPSKQDTGGQAGARGARASCQLAEGGLAGGSECGVGVGIGTWERGHLSAGERRRDLSTFSCDLSFLSSDPQQPPMPPENTHLVILRTLGVKRWQVREQSGGG